MTDKSRAIELRDLALPIVARHGAWETVTCTCIPGSRMNLRAYRDGEFVIMYRTPFQAIPKSPYQQNSPHDLPYGMDIWNGDKVLNIAWADDGRVELHGYKPGTWEQRLTKAARGM